MISTERGKKAVPLSVNPVRKNMMNVINNDSSVKLACLQGGVSSHDL